MKNYWYKEVKDHGPKNIVLCIAGNKCDLYEQEYVNENEAREFADSIGAIFALISAQNNNGINELFYDVGKKYLDLYFQKKLEEEKEKKEKKNQKGKTNFALNKKKLAKYISLYSSLLMIINKIFFSFFEVFLLHISIEIKRLMLRYKKLCYYCLDQ